MRTNFFDTDRVSVQKVAIKAAHEVYVNCVKMLQLRLNRHLGGVNAHLEILHTNVLQCVVGVISTPWWG